MVRTDAAKISHCPDLRVSRKHRPRISGVHQDRKDRRREVDMAVFPTLSRPLRCANYDDALVRAVGVRLNCKDNTGLDGFDWSSDWCLEIKPVMYLKAIPISENLEYRSVLGDSLCIERPPQRIGAHRRDSQHKRESRATA